MLDDRALTVNSASGQTNRFPALKMDPTRVARVSRWGTIAALQVAGALGVATSSCFWLPTFLSNGPTLGLLAFGASASALVNSGLRSREAYDFINTARMRRSSRMAAVVWVLSTVPLLFIALLFTPAATGQTIIFGWLAGLTGIVCVHLAAARGSHVCVQPRWLGRNVLVIGIGPEARHDAHLLCADGSGANMGGLVFVDRTPFLDQNENVDVVKLPGSTTIARRARSEELHSAHQHA